MQERLDWIRSYERTRDATATCRQYGICRATLRKWWLRYEAEGPDGLGERSRAPRRSPNRRLREEDTARILALRDRGLGLRRIGAALRAEHGIDLSQSTIRRALARATPPPAAPAGRRPAPRSALTDPALEEGLTAALAEAITQGVFQPGEKLAEEGLARRFGVGRTRLRQALRELSFLGLVMLERNRGAFVSLPSSEDVRGAYAARRVVEAGIVTELAGRAGGCPDCAELSALRRHVERQAAAEAAGHRTRLVKLLTDFHIQMARMAGNPFLLAFVEKLCATTSLAVLLHPRAGRPSCAVEEHRAIIRAIGEGDTGRAARLMCEHLGDGAARAEKAN